MTSKKIVLFKSKEESEEYCQLFKKNGIEAEFIPVLDFEYVNLDTCFNNFMEAHRYSGLIITSQRAIEGVAQCLACSPEAVPQYTKFWSKKPIFVVGEATNKKLQTRLSLSGYGYNSGTANALADFIIKEHDLGAPNVPLLFPCGNLRSETLPSKLKEADVKIHSIQVYETKKHPRLDSVLSHFDLPSTLVFFSPSGVEYALPILKKIDYDFQNSRLIAIGPVTAKKLEENALTVFATAEKPTPEAILNCIHQSLES